MALIKRVLSFSLQRTVESIETEIPNRRDLVFEDEICPEILVFDLVEIPLS